MNMAATLVDPARPSLRQARHVYEVLTSCLCLGLWEGSPLQLRPVVQGLQTFMTPGSQKGVQVGAPLTRADSSCDC